VALAGTLATGLVQARDADVQWSVTIGTPIGVPAYARPVPAYQQPYPQYQDSRYRRPTQWDRDGDGIPNRYDRVYNPSWDRDGDGVPNWQDRHDDRYRWGR